MTIKEMCAATGVIQIVLMARGDGVQPGLARWSYQVGQSMPASYRSTG